MAIPTRDFRPKAEEALKRLEAESPRYHEPDPMPALEAELKAEIVRLLTGPEGETEIERIYRDFTGPVSRRKAILAISNPRLGQCVNRIVKKGATELTVICKDHRIDFELSYSPRQDWIREGPVAQAEIVLPILRHERPESEFPPIGLAPIQFAKPAQPVETTPQKPTRRAQMKQHRR